MANQGRKAEAIPGIFIHIVKRIRRDKIHPSRKRKEPFYERFGHVGCYGYN